MSPRFPDTRGGSAYSEEARRWAALHPGDRKRLAAHDCTVCAHIEAHGWTGLSNATHCRNCHAIWGGHSTIHCVTCHRTFSNQRNLDAHQTRHRGDAGELRVRCHDPATVTIGKDDRRYFGEPTPNAHGVPIWRAARREAQP